MMYIDVSVNDGNFINIGKLNPLNDVNRLPPYPYSSDGFNLQITRCLNPLFDLSPFIGNRIKIRFRFQTNDHLYNAFRGWLVDCVEVTGEKIPDPVITTIEPVCNVEPTDILDIYGHNFANNATVTFDGIPAADWSVISADEIQANIPSNLDCPGPITVTVDNPGEGGVAVLEDAFMCGEGSCLPVANAGLDKLICNGDSVAIGGEPTAKGGYPPYLYQWLPTSGLNNATIANPIASPNETTLYTVTVTDSVSQQDNDSVLITVRNVPVSEFASNSPQCLGNEICFIDESSEEPDAWYWDFGDGIGTSTAKNPSYVYSQAGVYTVTLNASNSACSNSIPKSKDIQILSDQIEAKFTSNDAACIGNSISFTDISTGYPEIWLWDFGDGSSSDQQNPSHIYNNAGIYTVTLTIINRCGGFSQYSKQIAVSSTIPEASFTFSTPVCAGKPVQFQDLSTNNPTSWLWNFGDNSTSTLQNPIHTFVSPGGYFVTLIAYNGCGASSPRTNIVTVLEDIMPSAVSNSFEVSKYNSNDLITFWNNLPPNSTGIYQIVGLEYPSIPTPDNMANAPVVSTSNSGITGAIINNALNNPVKIIYYKVRGTGVCSGNPGPL